MVDASREWRSGWRWKKADRWGPPVSSWRRRTGGAVMWAGEAQGLAGRHGPRERAGLEVLWAGRVRGFEPRVS